MTATGSTISTLSARHQKFEAQNIEVNLDKRGELIKVYCNNAFVGIALVEKNKGELQIPPQIKESLQILTSSTETELVNAFKSVATLDKEMRGQAIDAKLSSILLFIEQFSSNDQLKRHITHTDVDNLLDQIQKLEDLGPPKDVKSRLTRSREIITAFKIDKVLSKKPILERNNDFNIRYYNDRMNDGFKVFEKLQTLLAKTEEGPLLTQLDDLEKCGKIKRDTDVKTADLKHGDLVYFERTPGNAFGDRAVGFAIVDKLQSGVALRVQSGDQSYIFVPQDETGRYTRLKVS